MAELDPFIFFRTLLFFFLATYSLLLFVSGIWRIKTLLTGGESARAALRLYLSYQLLTISSKPLRGEALQILFWLLLLVVIWWLHTLV